MTRSSQSMIRTLPRVMTTVTIRESTAALPTLFFIPSYPRPRNAGPSNRKPGSQSLQEAKNQKHDSSCRSNGCSAFTPTYLPYNNSIHQAIQLLEYISDNNGNYKFRNQFKGAPLSSYQVPFPSLSFVFQFGIFYKIIIFSQKKMQKKFFRILSPNPFLCKALHFVSSLLILCHCQSHRHPRPLPQY